MPDFRLRSDCREWFDRIVGTGTGRPLFDAYYLCFLLGISAARVSQPSEGIAAPVFVDQFVRPYDGCQRLLIGLMINADLRRLGIASEDRQSVNRIVGQLAGPGGLTQEGAQRMDSYVSGGYDLLIESYDLERPRGLEEFLPRYLRILDTAAAASSDV